MRVLIFSRYPIGAAQRLLVAHGLTPVKTKPDLVLCWGGDGTFLYAERRFPGVPKILVRHGSICRKCTDLPIEQVIARLAKGMNGLKIVQEPKLAATVRKRKRTTRLPLAANDVVIRNKHQMTAVRFSVLVDGKPLAAGQVGDGVVIATPFGSAGYHSSITGNTFRNGIGIAFNNTVQPQPGYVVDEGSVVEVAIDRGNALVSVDADKRTYPVSQGDRIIVKRAKASAKVVRI